jgi:hypothetical protein
MGTVYLAEDVRLGRKAAIKTMKAALAARAEDRERFLREARAAASVEHDNIVPVWQVGESFDGSPFITMPFLQGETLEARLKREPAQPLPVLLKVAREVAEGLAAAHARGLIHRDIKPSNVWVEGDPGAKDLAGQVRRCKVLDFGLVRSLAGDSGLVTANGSLLGTPSYMAPEQANGEPVDARADLFSLGVMLYRMATGRLPFAGANTMAVLTALATATPPPACSVNPNVPPALSELIGRLMSKDPAGRPRSAAEVVVAVRRVVKELQAERSAPPLATAIAPAVPAPPVNPWEDITLSEPAPPGKATPAAQAKRRRPALLAAVGLLALAPLAWWLATTVLRVETPTGTLVVEINDAETETRVKGGKLILTGPDGKVRYVLSPSEGDRKIDAGPYKVRVEGADGVAVSTSEFTLKKNDKVTVRVTAVAKAADPDRKAAEWVLSLGGMVKLNAQDRSINVIADLPREPFRLTAMDLGGNRRVSDAGLAHFKDCKSLVGISLDRTPVSDAGLAHFKDCKGLIFLSLTDAKIGDVGLATFKDCKLLWGLGLKGTQVTDAGLAHFSNCQGLGALDLSGTKVGDAGLAHLKGCKKLAMLDLRGTKVSDLSLLRGMPVRDLGCDFKAERDAKVLRSLPTLQTINGKPVKQFWQEVDARKP